MSSIQMQTLDQQGFSSSTSGSSAQIEETRSVVVSPSETPAQSPRSSLHQQQRQLQVQQRYSLERSRTRTPATGDEARQAALQLATQPQAQQQQPQRNSNSILRSVWTAVVKERGFEVAVFGLLLGILMMAPTIGQYATSVWSSAKDYQDWCKDEQSANHTLTRTCSVIVNKPLPPPPGLNQVFKDIGRREPATVIAPRADAPPFWRTSTDEEKEAINAFICGPVGNGISLMILGFFVLWMPLERRDLKWFQFGLIACIFRMTRKSSLMFVLKNVAILMDWAFWLRRVGVRGPSLGYLAVMPVLYAVGYMNEKSTTTEIVIAVLSVLVVGDTYSHMLLAVYQVLNGLGINKAAKGSKGAASQ